MFGSLSLALAVAVAGGNLLPTDYASNHVGGFLGWETGGANVRVLGEKGPEGGKVLRFTDSGGTFSFAHEKRRLAPGGLYRLSANVRVKNLADTRRFELMLHPWPWSVELKASLPRETDGAWRAVEWKGVLPPSEGDLYDVTVYSSGSLASDAFFDLADLRLEALDEKAAAGASPIPEAKPYVARVCPVDPSLGDVDPRHASIRFYYGGPVAAPDGRPHVLRVTLCGRTVSAPFGEDHLATVDFGEIPAGRHPLRAEVAPSADGPAAAANEYVAIARPVVANPTPGRRLNNLVTELYTKPLRNGDYEFTLAKASYVYIGTDRACPGVVGDLDDAFPGVVRHRPRELNGSTRFLEAGRHVLRVRGVTEAAAKGTVSVRLVKALAMCGHANALAGKYVTYRMDERFFDICGLWGTVNFTGARIDLSDSARAKLADRGVEVFGDVSCAAHLPIRDDRAALTRHFTGNRFFTSGIPFCIDENGVNVGTLKRYNCSEALWEVCRSGLRVNCFFEDGYRARFDRPGLDYPDLSAYVNLGEGRSYMCSECYWRSPVDEGEFEATVDFMHRQIRQLRSLVPSAPSHLLYYLNGFMTIGSWTSWIHPHVDMKAFDARILHVLATDPEFADIGGVGTAGVYCDEDYVRSMFAAFRHYAIEGRTDDFATSAGLVVFPGHLANGEFDAGFEGWRAKAAEEGTLSLGHAAGYGTRNQLRRCFWFERGSYAVGENFAVFTRSGKGPNLLSQTLRGLKPGSLYQVTFATMNGADFAKPGSVNLPERPSLHVTVRGAEKIPELAHVARVFEKKTKTTTYAHRIVFRATSETATLEFGDWADGKTPGGEIGEKWQLNYIGCNRYFVRDEEELAALKGNKEG